MAPAIGAKAGVRERLPIREDGKTMRDPYVILGVRRNAGQDEIKAAWRLLAKAVHPDHNQDDPNAAERFAEVDPAIVQPNADALQHAAALPAVGSVVQIRQAIFDNLSLCLSDTLTPEEAILQASDVVNDLLAE